MTIPTLPPIRLVPEPLSDEAAALLVRPPHVDPVVGTRHRIGGTPDADHDAPDCPQGDGPMTFYGQLDGLPATSAYDLADAGLILVFVCFACFEVEAVLHSA
ncbi:MAG TPA: hypothetical protein VF230_06245 [Acidimicrobiales bacterium]